MASGKFKKVLFETEVPEGGYCWGNGRPCQHLVFGEGRPRCGLRHGFLRQDEHGYIKPNDCRKMKEV